MDTRPILNFIEQYKIAERLKLDSSMVTETLLKVIAWEIGLGHSYEQAAQVAFTQLDFMAVDTHIASDEDFNLAYIYEKELVKAIKEAYN